LIEEKDKLGKRIGSRLNMLRKQRGFTLSEIARQTHLSPSLISRIENGQIMASIQTLQLIADTLKIDIGFFFQQEQGKGYAVSRSGSRRMIPADDGKFKGDPTERRFYDIEPLADGIENPFMVPLILKIVNRDEKINPPPHGGQEFVYLLEGKLLHILGEERIILKKGDALYFDGNIPHKAISLSKKPAKALVVHMVPGRRVRSIVF
jgi:transcriptional regulator with XRE-family HTH domain